MTIKAILDTNVIVSDIFWQGSPFEILKAWQKRHFLLAVSLPILNEYRRVLDELYSSDRGFFSETNVKSCKQKDVKVVCIPQRGGKKTAKRKAYEKSPAFKEGQRFRAGIEGRISVLFRGRGMKRCRDEGRKRFELWVGAAVLANNLMRIATLLSERTRRKRKAA